MNYEEKYFTESTTKNKDAYLVYRDFLKNAGVELKDKVVLDVGCATGAFLEDIISANECYGIDISKYAIDVCRKKYPQFKNNFSQLNLDEQKFSSKKKFDMISMFDTIEHLYNYVNFKEILDVNLKKGGYLMVTTPNANSLLRFFSSKSFTGELDKTHTILFTPYTLDFLLRRMGLKRIMLFTPFSFYFKNNFLTNNVLMGGQIVAIYRK